MYEFDPNSVSEAEEKEFLDRANKVYEPVPEGEQQLLITDFERKDIKSGNGSRLNLQIKILNGEYNGRIIFKSLNLWHCNNTGDQKMYKETNKTMSRHIAECEMKNIANSLGISNKITNFGMLLERPLMGMIKINKGNNGKLYNNISSFKPINAATQPQSSGTVYTSDNDVDPDIGF